MEAIALTLALVLYLVATIAGGLHLALEKTAIRVVTLVALAGAFLLHAAAIGLRSMAVGNIAVTSFAEQLSFFAWLLVGIYLLAQTRYRLAVLEAVISPIAFIGALGSLVDHGAVRDLPPGFKSPWLPVHVTFVFLGNAVFGLAFFVSLIYLVEERQLKSRRIGSFARRLPSLETLDKINFRFLTWGFVCLTLGMLSGVLWAELSWGRLWSWDPLTFWTTVIWILYAVLLHGRVTVGWGGRRAATLTIVGFGVLFVSFIGVNMLSPGRHAGSFG
jgi:cytochrome c-type biogenesis protein CcsB